MSNLFVDDLINLPKDYSIQLNSDYKNSPEKSISYKGRQYTLVGSYKKEYSLVARVCLIFCCFIKTILTAGLGLFNTNLQEDWKAAFSGKKIGKVYCDKRGLVVKSRARQDSRTSSSPKANDKEEEAKRNQPRRNGAEGEIETKNPPLTPPPVVRKASSKGSKSKAQIIEEMENPPVSPLPDLKKAPSQANKAKNFTPINFSDLQKEISYLSKKGDPALKKKGALLQQSVNLFFKHRCPIELETYRLSKPNDFKLLHDQKKYTAFPEYFKQEFNSKNAIKFESTPALYDYKMSEKYDVEDYWADFANASLGGGAFTRGFVQEEIMVHEMPDFAAHIAGNLSSSKPGWCDISIREGSLKDRNRVGKGSPNPYLLKGLHRVQAVNNKMAYGDKFEALSQKDLIDSTLPLPAPQKVNLIAIAAPKLFSKNSTEQWDPLTLEDNFNTLMAGFSLVKEQATKKPVIHSGRIGCGVFNNDIHAIYLLSYLAAQHLGVDLVLHGYSTAESNKFQLSWNALVPQLVGKPLKDCMAIISNHLHGK